jgi:hypothetical protein
MRWLISLRKPRFPGGNELKIPTELGIRKGGAARKRNFKRFSE